MKAAVEPSSVHKGHVAFGSFDRKPHARNEEDSDLFFGLKLFFNTAHALFICPFYLSKTSKQGYVLKTKLWHKVICILYAALGTLWLLGEIRLSIPPADKRNPRIYFKMASTLVDTIFKMIFLKQLWWNQVDILNIVSFLEASKFTKFSKQHGRISRIKLGLTSLFIFYVGCSTFVWSVGTTPQFPLTLENWWNGMVAQGGYNFFLESGGSNSWGKEAVAGCLTAIGYYQRRTWGTYTDLLVIVVVFMLYQAVCRFIDKLRIEAEWDDVRGEYKKLAKLCELANSFIGSNLACTLTIMIITMATGLHGAFFTSEKTVPLQRFFVFHYSMSSLAVLYGCSDICHRVRHFTTKTSAYIG